MARIIAVIGDIGAGKSEVAKILRRNYGYRIEKFAGPLKRMLALGLGLNQNEIDGELKDKPCEALCGKTPRHAMQALGTEWGRQMIGEDLWVSHAVRAIRGHPHDAPCVVDDMRYDNERAAMRAEGAHVVRIMRSGIGLVDPHSSEVDHRRWTADFTMRNDGSLVDLAFAVDELMLQIYAKEAEVRLLDESARFA